MTDPKRIDLADYIVEQLVEKGVEQAESGEVDLVQLWEILFASFQHPEYLEDGYLPAVVASAITLLIQEKL